MVGLDETRRLEERARHFLFRFGSRENILVLDASELDLTGIDDRFKGYSAPLIFFDVLWRFAYQLAARRNQTMLAGRRYMKKISNY
jgi:fructoselysine 6-phosphate deglycase